MRQEDFDFDKYVDMYGDAYLEEIDPDFAIYDMRCLDKHFTSAWKAISSAFYGYAYSRDSADRKDREVFNPNSPYFTFNDAGNLVSIEEYDIHDFIADRIEYGDFLEWLKENEYID